MKKLRYAIAILLFLITVVVAVWHRWSAADLAWASWISSVVVGVTLITLSLASFSLLFSPSPTGLRYGCGMWFLFLFIVPWSVLQSVVALGLHAVFPLHRSALGMDDVLLRTITAYWPFVLMSVASELASLRSYWRLAGRMSEGGSYPFLFHGQIIVPAKMFLFVWLLAALSSAGLAGYLLYPTLIFYFFPWEVVSWRDLLRRSQGRQPSHDPDVLTLRFGGGLLCAIGWPCLLAGAFFLSLPMWKAGLRDSTIPLITGSVLALAGAVLALGRSETILDRRNRKCTSRYRLGILRYGRTDSLEGIGSVRLERVSKAARVFAPDNSETMTVTARDGEAGYSYDASLTRGGREALYLWELSFVGVSKARELAEEVAAFLNLSVEEDRKSVG
jgi:hypothetical protein